MSLTFTDLQDEVKRRAVRNQGGTQFDTAVKNLINVNLFRLSREALWRPLRRTASFNTEAEYKTGTVTATNDSTTLTGSSTAWITAGIEVGRRLTIEGSSKSFTVEAIASNTSLTLNRAYDGTTDSGLTYTIYGREEYNLPVQTARVAFLWHEEYGYPYLLQYVPSQAFFSSGVDVTEGDTPTHYRMWGEDDVLQQPIAASVLTISSSVDGDISKDVTVFGTVSGYPDFEVITTHSTTATTAVNGSKSFTKIDRVTKDASTTGRITVTANSANVTVAVLPTGDATGAIQYKKIQLWPLPTTVFPVQVWYYKEVWRLVNVDDIHELGQEFDEALILLSVAKLKAENSQQEALSWYGLYKDELRSLKETNADKLDFLPTLQRPARRRFAGGPHPFLSYQQLGGQYGPRVRP